jgi:hypothetical protein
MIPDVDTSSVTSATISKKSTHDQRNASYTSSFQPKKSHDRFEIHTSSKQNMPLIVIVW